METSVGWAQGYGWDVLFEFVQISQEICHLIVELSAFWGLCKMDIVNFLLIS